MKKGLVGRGSTRENTSTEVFLKKRQGLLGELVVRRNVTGGDNRRRERGHPNWKLEGHLG